MAHIRERSSKNGKKTYNAQIRIKGISVQSATFSRKTDAVRWAQQVEADIRRGRYFPKSKQRYLLKELIQKYLDEITPSKAVTTIPIEKIRLNWWIREYGAYRLMDITPELLEDSKKKLREKGNGNTGTKRYLRTLSHVFTIAVDWGWMHENPMKKVKMPVEPKGRIRYLDEDELQRFSEACRESACSLLYPAVVLSLSSGMRKGELSGLTWNRVDLKRGHIILDKTKSGKPRGIPISGHALELLRKMSKIRRIDTRFVFPSKDGIKGFDFRRSFAAALKKANIENFHWHDLRHTCASYMVMTGASLKTVADLLGHSDISMAQRYSHLSDEFLAAEVARKDEMMFK